MRKSSVLLILISLFLSVSWESRAQLRGGGVDTVVRPVDDFVITLTRTDFPKGYTTHYIVINYGFEATSDANARRIYHLQPYYHDFLLRSLLNYMRVIWKGQGPLRRDHIKKLMLAAAERIYGEGVVKDITLKYIRVDRAF